MAKEKNSSMRLRWYNPTGRFVAKADFSTLSDDVRKMLNASSDVRIRLLLSPDPKISRTAMRELAREYWSRK